MEDSSTPLMKQYREIKVRFPDSLLFFQVGDFYELFFDDAKRASAFLGIALTKRGKLNGEPIPLCGVPIHALEHYLTKLIRGGFKVALCDQLEEARPGKVVDRGVTRVFTPGTLTESALLDAKNSSYIFSFFPGTQTFGLLFGELLTAQLFATTVPAVPGAVLESELVRFFPDEILLPDTALGKSHQPYFKQLGYFTSLVHFADNDAQQVDVATAWMHQFKHDAYTTLTSQESIRGALYHFYAYMRATQHASLLHFNTLQFYKADDFLMLDAATQRNLEIVRNNQDGGRAGTLFSVMDGAATPMGSRMIKKWLLRPLIKKEAIEQRYDVIQDLVNDAQYTEQLKACLTHIGDCERVIGRIALRRAGLPDYLLLLQALENIPLLRDLLIAKKEIALIATIIEHCPDFAMIRVLLAQSLNDDATKEWIIKKGFDTNLDAMRDLIESGNQKIIEMEQAEQHATGIGSLKIRYNQVHGYSIEITKTHYDAVPSHYIRRQTLVGRERFTTPALQQLEDEIAHARTEIVSVENHVFEQIKNTIAPHVAALRKVSHALSHLDALLGFASIAYNHNYIRPLLHTSKDIIIEQGRHPVVERAHGGTFIPNDTLLTDAQSVWIITGPNMGGKSTYLRQVGLLSIMAQAGSFIPARAAQLPILDRVFTRIGAGDNLVGGKSTFMVEMEETASICTHATEKSLVILDEVGRGTSTFDGLAIAQAVVEYIYQVIGARCLFATHYHELTTLEATHSGIASFYAASKKKEQGIIFLYKIMRGVADGSFGVEVAKLAALPKPVIARAQEILHELQALPAQSTHFHGAHKDGDAVIQKECAVLRAQVEQQGRIIAALQNIDYNNLSPKQAFDLLWKIKENM